MEYCRNLTARRLALDTMLIRTTGAHAIESFARADGILIQDLRSALFSRCGTSARLAFPSRDAS